MKKSLVVLAIAVVCWAGETRGAPLSLTLSSPNNLMELLPGDSALINVNLTALQSGEQLVSLIGSVHFSGALLGTPLSISPGSVVPGPSDFASVSIAGQADGGFLLPLGADPIRRIGQNGVFYSFSVQAQAVGSGAFTLDSLIAEQYDPQNPLLPILRIVGAGVALPFNINVIPAPPALGLALLGLVIVRRKFSRQVG